MNKQKSLFLIIVSLSFFFLLSVFYVRSVDAIAAEPPPTLEIQLQCLIHYSGDPGRGQDPSKTYSMTIPYPVELDENGKPSATDVARVKDLCLRYAKERLELSGAKVKIIFLSNLLGAIFSGSSGSVGEPGNGGWVVGGPY